VGDDIGNKPQQTDQTVGVEVVLDLLVIAQSIVFEKKYHVYKKRKTTQVDCFPKMIPVFDKYFNLIREGKNIPQIAEVLTKFIKNPDDLKSFLKNESLISKPID